MVGLRAQRRLRIEGREQADPPIDGGKMRGDGEAGFGGRRQGGRIGARRRVDREHEVQGGLDVTRPDGPRLDLAAREVRVEAEPAVAVARQGFRDASHAAPPGIGQEGPFGPEAVAGVVRVREVRFEDEAAAIGQPDLEDPVVLAARQRNELDGIGASGTPDELPDRRTIEIRGRLAHAAGPRIAARSDAHVR